MVLRLPSPKPLNPKPCGFPAKGARPSFHAVSVEVRGSVGAVGCRIRV